MCSCIFGEYADWTKGVLPCAINAISLALLDAGVPMSDYVLSVGVGMHLPTDQTLLDLAAAEEGAMPSIVVAYLARSRTATLAQLETRLHADAIPTMLKYAGDACAGALLREVDSVMGARTRKLAEAMEGRGPTSSVVVFGPEGMSMETDSA